MAIFGRVSPEKKVPEALSRDSRDLIFPRLARRSAGFALIAEEFKGATKSPSIRRDFERSRHVTGRNENKSWSGDQPAG
jgi:hypothetical protein